MIIYLLPLDDGRLAFHSDGPEAPSTAPSGRFRGWLDRKGRALAEALGRSEGSVVSWFRGVWTWLHRWTGPDEEMLRSLRLATDYELAYPPTRTEEEARGAWTHYLAVRKRRHLAWLAFNAAIVPGAALLALLPGPNVLGYWFFYRAVMHLLAWLGTRRALARADTTAYRPLEDLDDPVPTSEVGRRALADRLGSPGLVAYLDREAPIGPGSPRTAETEVETDAPAQL